MTVLIGCLISSSLMTPMTKAPIVLAQGEERKGHANRNPRLMALVVDEKGNPRSWNSAFD